MQATNLIIPYVTEKEGKIERTYDIYSRLLKDRIIMLTTEVEDNMASSIVSQLLFLEAQDPDKDIFMYINSPGGVITSGMAIFDTMNLIKPDVQTICLGQAASMGAFLLSAGAPGKRYSLPHSRIMIHQPLGGARGQASDILLHANEILRMKQELTTIMAESTNGITSYERMVELTDRDNFLSPQEALSLGLIDEIITRKK
jgi:ATP-dependent Clp protease protease subunit